MWHVKIEIISISFAKYRGISGRTHLLCLDVKLVIWEQDFSFSLHNQEWVQFIAPFSPYLNWY